MLMQHILSTYILSIVLFNNVLIIVGNNPSTCEKEDTCDSCIGVKGCTWCTELFDPGTKYQRCNTLEGHRGKNGCPTNKILKAESKYEITKNVNIGSSMRIQPQRAEAYLGVGNKTTIDLTYKDGEDKPLDLYYIMDLSWTMNNDKAMVSNQAQNLVNELGKITKKVKIGFGSFIDKPVLPFVAASHLRPNQEQDVPYGFRNKLSLTDDVNEFRRAVNEARISVNEDLPEGTFDALMQAITCVDEIGWRNESSKLVVVATDGPFHIAGDGKLGGIVRPNDLKCHLENNEYTHSTLLDYPSISEIHAVTEKYKVFVIFAVSASEDNRREVFELYQKLRDHVTHSDAVELKSDSSNVVEKVKKKYEEIRETVRIKVENPTNNVDVTIETKCASSQSGIYVQQDFCRNVKREQEIKFKINLELKKCPDPRQKTRNETIVVSFFQLSSKEKLEIKLNYNCECSGCKNEKEQRENYLVKHCSGTEASNYISCGQCFCKKDRYGDSCQCSRTDERQQGNRTNCIDPNSKTNVECSGRVECNCGQCDCPLQQFNGKYCQDSTAECQNPQSKYPTKLCSDNGQCQKGKCRCFGEYEGKFCECMTSKKVSCVEPGSSLNNTCNGHGTCICPEGDLPAYCSCELNYGGLYCGVCKNNCPSSGDQLRTRCEDKFLQTCVRCRIREYNESNPSQNVNKCRNVCLKGKESDRGAAKGLRDDVSTVEFIELNGPQSLDDKADFTTECKVQVNTSCTAKFRYGYRQSSKFSDFEADALEVYYKPNETVCQKEPNLLGYIFGTIIGVLVVGILTLLLWKLFTHLHDRREYQRFLKETSQAKWSTNDNPLFKKPLAEFENPAYRE